MARTAKETDDKVQDQRLKISIQTNPQLNFVVQKLQNERYTTPFARSKLPEDSEMLTGSSTKVMPTHMSKNRYRGKSASTRYYPVGPMTLEAKSEIIDIRSKGTDELDMGH